MKKTVIILVITAFIALYSYIMSYGFITIDPCTSTPGRNNTIGYILTAIFPVLLGLLLYFLISHKKVFRFKTFLKLTTLSVGWLAVAFILWGFAIIRPLSYFVVTRTKIIPYISEYGCYNDIELTDLSLYLAWCMCSVVTGFVIYLIVKWKYTGYIFGAFLEPVEQVIK
jgi:hypothetical protein